MSSSVAAPSPDDNGNPQGHCSQCHKVWILNKRQGVCPWCGNLAICQSSQTKPRRLNSRSNRSKRQAPVIGNGYDQLQGEWLIYYKVALRFVNKVKPQDKEDILDTIITVLADVERNNGHKPYTEAVMYRIASRTVADYWRTYYKASNGLDCGSCSKIQRQQCKEDNLYSQCPRAIKLEYLSKPILDNEGNLTELGNLIADDKALDLDAWADARTFLLGFPQRLLAIAHKRLEGIPLDNADKLYLGKWRKREQKKLGNLDTFQPQIPTTIVEAR